MNKCENIYKLKKHKNFLKILSPFLFIIMAIVLFFSIYLFSHNKLNVELLSSFNSPSFIYANDDSMIKQTSNGRPFVKLSELNQYTIDSFISIEDTEFYKHKGINIKRIIKAFYNNVKARSLKEGASTISQQLIKNTHLTNEKTFSRKINEIVLALKLENKFSKDEILEMYLNAIYFGNGCYGIESASNFYFGKSATQLNINESATLASLIKSPSNYNPLNNYENLKERRNLVLTKLYEQNKIDNESIKEIKNNEIPLNINDNSNTYNNAYIYSALDEASNILNITSTKLLTSKYKIYTYYDNDITFNLHETVKNNTNAKHNAMIIDNQTNGIISFVSSYSQNGFSVKRAPASSIKPLLVYAPAIEYNYIYPCSILDDKPTTFDNYKPQNIGNKYYDKISASSALAKSLNIPAISLLNEIGIDKCKKFAKNLGINFDKDDNGLSLALGAMKYGITINELCSAYSPFVNDGMYSKATFIKKILDKYGKVVYEHKTKSNQVMSKETSYLVGQMMRKTVQDGTATALKSFPFEIHAKSGTNGSKYENLNTDALCLTQTTKHTACIWYYSCDNKKENLIENPSISQLSPTIKLKEIFNYLYSNNKPSPFVAPSSIETILLDKLSYDDNKIEIASINTPERFIMKEEFKSNYKPTTLSTNFTMVKLSKLNLESNANNVTLFFEPQKHQRYVLVKQTNLGTSFKEEILSEYKNTSTPITYEDTTNQDNSNTKYYILIYNDYISKSAKSNIVHLNTNQSNEQKNKESKNYFTFFKFWR